MQMIMLAEELQTKLANLPEHGMDYQVCDLTLKDGTVLKSVPVTGCRAAHLPTSTVTTEDVVDVSLSY